MIETPITLNVTLSSKKCLEHFIRSQVNNPQESEISEILDAFSPAKYSKGDFFKEQNSISTKLGFICKGSVSVLLHKDNGTQIIGNIVPKRNFISDIFSLRKKVATPYGLQFLEDSSILETSVNTMEALLKDNLTFNILLREYLTELMMDLSQRYMLFLTGTARERYEFIVATYPELLDKYPLKIIASLIGVTPTQLSRIRKPR